MRATGKGPATTLSCALECDCFITFWGYLHLVNQTDEAVDKSDKIYSKAHARHNAPSLSPLLQLQPTTQPQRAHDSHQELPRHQAVNKQQGGQMGHQELSAVRGQDGLHTRRRNLHRPGQGPPLALLRSAGSVVCRLVENHMPTRITCCSWIVFYNSERTGSPGSGHRHAKPQALHQGTWKEADRTWPV